MYQNITVQIQTRSQLAFALGIYDYVGPAATACHNACLVCSDWLKKNEQGHAL